MYISVIKQTVADGVHILDGVSLQMVLPSVMSALEEYLRACYLELPTGQLLTMYRVEIQGAVYYSRQYKRVKKRNSYTIHYFDKNHSKKIAFIEYFIFVHQKVIAVLKPLLPLHVSCQKHFHLNTNVSVSFLHPVCIVDSYSFCFVDDIIIYF